LPAIQIIIPGDGSYGFSVNYHLPSSGGETTSWLASGWAGTGTISIFAEEDENMLIGRCKFNLNTFVTENEAYGMFQIPSAAASVGIVSGTVAALALVCLYLRCCTRRKRTKEELAEDGAWITDPNLTRDDINTLFKRLDEDTKTDTPVESRRVLEARHNNSRSTDDDDDEEEDRRRRRRNHHHHDDGQDETLTTIDYSQQPPKYADTAISAASTEDDDQHRHKSDNTDISGLAMCL